MKKNLHYNIEETIKDINRLSKLLKESYVFDDEDMDEYDYSEEEFENVEEPQEPEMKKNYSHDKINQIRSLALSGIQDFAEQVDSDEYQIFKNIWMTCDKFYSNKNKEEKI